MDSNDPTRLNKYLASRLNVGRRAADLLIASGQVWVNGKQAELGDRVVPGDEIVAEGKLLDWDESHQFTYLLMDKPTGYVCSRRQQGDAHTIYSLLPQKYQHLKTVGRLDKNSSGLILLTNDGDLAHRLTHPKFAKVKKYEVTLDKPLQPLHHQMIADHGINLPDGKSQFALERLVEGDDTQWLVIMSEGRNRQIRRTFAALDYDVTRLRRVQFGEWHIDNLRGKRLGELDIASIT
ncbi:MAG TPA: pseudouridine synthase [Candidatus Saccharimonadales bacterium]|nr:pseudouridine synthase [Candidatus Saccharimonadales bacterium]